MFFSTGSDEFVASVADSPLKETGESGYPMWTEVFVKIHENDLAVSEGIKREHVVDEVPREYHAPGPDERNPSHAMSFYPNN